MYYKVIHSIQYNSDNKIISINYFRCFCANYRSLLKYIANKKYQVLSQAPKTFHRVRSWLSMAVVALTRVQRVEGIEPKRVSERGKHHSSSSSSPPRRRELHAACLCLDEPVSRTVTSGSPWPLRSHALSRLVSRPALPPPRA